MTRFLLLFGFSIFTSLAVASSSLVCPIDSLGGERKKVGHFFSLNKTDKLVICVPAGDVDNGKLKSRFLTEYAAYLFRHDESVNRVFSGSGTTPVRFQQRKKKVYEIVHLNLQGSFYPLFKNQIACENVDCKRVDKVCVYDQSQLPAPQQSELEKEYLIYSKASSQKQEITQAELAQMSVLALGGRRFAFDFFTSLNPQPIVIGPAKDFYNHMKGLLNQMSLEGCLKVREK